MTLPMRFEPNRGQVNDETLYIGRSGGYEIHFTPDRAELQMPSAAHVPQTLPIFLEAANKTAHIVPAAALPGKSNYLLGSDATSWITNLPNYGQLQYQQVYPGIDLVFYGNRGRLEYDFIVSPNGNADAIGLRTPQTAQVSVAANGDLTLKNGSAEIQLLKPVIYQFAGDGSGRKDLVSGEYRLIADASGTLVKFSLGAYDRSRPLIIDPVLSYSTDAGISGNLESIAVDGTGNAYILSEYYQPTVTKLSSDGSTVLYTTTVGANYSATGTSLAVDSTGKAHFVAYASTGYPTTNNSYRPVSGGGTHIAYTVLTAAGDGLAYSTYILGSSTDYPLHVAVDSAGKAYISGFTYSSDFPNTGSGAFGGYYSGFVTKMDPTKAGDAGLVYSNLIPAGSSYATAPSVAVDSSFNAYVAINDDTLAVTPGAYNFFGINYYDGGSYVSKYDASGALVYTSYLGYGEIRDIAADNGGSVYATGRSDYGDFPATAGAYQTQYPYGYVAKLDPTGSTLVYSTFLSGPSGQVQPQSISLLPGCASNCVAYIGGSTAASDFPVINAIQNLAGGGTDAFIVTLSGDGSAATFSTYVGGSTTDDYGQSLYQHIPAVRLDNAGNMYLGGNTSSADFPFSSQIGTGAYVVKVSPSNSASLIPNAYSINFNSGTVGIPVQQNLVLRNYGTATLTLNSPTVTGDFSQSNSCGGSIAPGSSCTFQLSFTPTNAGQRYGTITFTHNGVNSPTQVQLTGYGYDQAYITLSPQQIQFTPQTVGSTSAVQPITVTNTGSQPASYSSISLNDSTNFAQTNNCPSVLGKGASCTVNVTFNPTNVGVFSTPLYVSYSAGYNGNSYVMLYGSGTQGSASAVVSPGSLQFADDLIGDTNNYQLVYVTNTGTVPITMGGATVTGDYTINYNNCSVNSVVAPGSTCYMYVYFAPTAAGTRTGTLTIASTAAGFPASVSLSGNGIAPLSGISLSPVTMTFADQVLNTSSSVQSVLVSNTGTSQLAIERVYSTSPDFVISYSSCSTVSLSPLQSCGINIQFRPTGTGLRTGSVMLVDGDPSSPQSITLSGNGLAPTTPLYVSPQLLSFDDTVVNTTSQLSFYMTNPGNTAITVSSITSDSPDFAVSYNGCSTVSPSVYNYSCSVNVIFQPTSLGAKSATLTINDSGTGNPHTVTLQGNSIASTQSVVITPQAYTFGDQVIGTASSYGGFAFYNPGTSPVHVSSIAASGDYSTSNSCSTISPGSYCYIYVQFTPTAAGLRSGTLTMFDDAPGNPHTVALTGNGLTATSTVEVSPSSTNFLDQPVGTPSTAQIIYFYNTGNSKVTIGSLAASGDFAISSNGCGTTISPGSYCYAYVTFTPSAPGARTGALTMTDDAPGSPHGANLSGNGLAATKTLVLSPASLDFGNLVVNGTAGSQSLYLVNSGSQPVKITAITPSTNVTSSGCVTTLSDGSTCQLTVTFKATAAGTQTGSVTVTSDATGSPQTINITGNGVASTPAVSLTPNGVAFNQQVAATSSGNIGVSFKNSSGASLTVSGVVATGDFSVVSNGCNTVGNGSSCSVVVNFTPTAAGVRTGTLTFTHNGTGGTIAANLTGFGLTSTKSAELTPTGLTFTDQVVNTSSSVQTVYLYNQGTVPFNVSGTPTISGDFTLTSNTCSGAVSNYCYVQVKFQPTTTGTRTGVVTINDDSPTSPHTISLTGTGVASTNTVYVTATSIGYPDQPLNTDSTVQTIYLYDTGNTTVNLGSPVITGDFSITSKSCTTTVSAGSYCYYQVKFTPTATGARTGSLSLPSDSSSGTQTIALSGNGIAATKTIVLSTNTMAYGDTPIGVTNSNNQYFYLYNTGSLPVTVSSASVTGDFIINYNSCSTISPGSYCYIYVQFKPTAAGTRTGTVQVNDDAGGNPHQVAVTGQGVAVVKTARLSVNSMVFPDQAVGTTSSSQYAYLYNQSNVPLNVSAITVSGDFAVSYQSCGTPPTSVGVNSYCYFYLTFSPTTTGTRTGALTFTDDSSNSPHVMTLSGKGTSPNPSITASTTSLVFGSQEVSSTSGLQYVYLYSNSNVPITFGTATIDNADFGINYTYCSSFNAPGQSCYYAINFTPSATGSRTGTLTIPSNANGSPIKVSLSGTGIAAGTGAQFSHTSVEFGNQVVGVQSSGVTLYYSNAGSTSISVSSTTITGDFLKDGGCNGPTTIGSKGYCVVNLYFKPSTTGSLSGTLTFTDNATGSPHNIALHGTGVPATPNAAVNPNNLQFSNQLVGVTSSGQSVSVTNTGTATLTVSGVSITPSTDFAVYSNGCTSLAPNNYCYITLTFNPTAGGLRSATLQIADNTATSPHSVALSGTGIASSPVYAISTNNIGFGSFGVGTPSNPAGVTLYNNGNSAMTISSISASSEFSISSSNCGTSLAANTNCSFNVTFTPAATGVRTGTVTIADNAAGNPHQIALSGTGIAPIGAQVSPGTLIFQNQAVSTSSSAQTVTLAVTGAAVTVSSVSLSGGDFSQTNNCSGAYTYNSACYVNVTFAPSATGNRSGTLTIIDNSPSSPHVVALSGNGTGSPAVTLSSTSLNFNSVNKGTTSAVQTVTLTNTGNGPLGLGTISASGDYAQTNNCSPNLNANISCTISITFTPTTYGTRTGTVTINDNATGNPHTVNLTGIGLASGASVGPTSLNFTTQSVGTTSAAQGVTLTNVGTLPLNITSIASNSTEFPQTNACSATLAVNANCVISVKFAPTGAGARSGSLSIVSDDGNLTVPLGGTGTGPVASFDKASLAFGSVSVGTPSATQTITLSSTGDTALTISSITTSGDFSQTNNCPTSLAATSTCTIQVTFTPTAPGSRTGFVTVVNNAANSPQQITLGGSGFGASISFNPPSLNYSTVQVGSTSSAQTITLSNAGTQTLSITSIAVTGDFAQTNNCPSSLAATSSCTVTVTFTPTAPGARSGSLNVVNSTGTQSAPLSGFGVTQGLTFNPGSLPFGSLPVGLTSAAQTVTVTANGALPVTITNIAASGDFALATNTCPSVLQATSSCTISVTFTPTAQGARTGAVTFTDDAPGSPQTIALTGTGTVPTADLVLSGSATPKSAPPGGSATFNIVVDNSGPSTATGVTLTMSAPSNASLQSVTPSTGTCSGSSTITCTVASLTSGTGFSVVMIVNNTAQGPMTTTISASANESDPNTANNSLPLTSDTSVADIQVVAASTTTTLSGQPAFTMAVTNNGPSNASGVVATYDLDRFGYVNSVASQGSCSFGAQLVCNFGSIATGASASVTIAVQPPDSGWTSIEARATANQYDPVPNNNVAQISPSLDGSNTKSGTNVSVNTADPSTGATANLVFAAVTRPGSTTMTAAAAPAPPSGYRSPRASLSYDFSTSAQFSGAVALTLNFAPSALYHPAKARLFHNEGGVWVDRTASLNPAGTIAGVTSSLSQFAIFEPPDQPPVANPGTAVVVAGTNASGNQVRLNGSLSTDPENDALTYKWTGPFPEGNGTVTGPNPMVTMPVGASQVTLVVNDGEVDSAPVAQAVTVSDFAVSANVSAITVPRGQTANLTIALSPKFGAYDRAVALDCANLPADLTCQFAQPSVTPDANGSTVMLTIAAAKTTAAATHGGSPKTFALWLLGLGLPFGFVSIAGNRKRRLGWLLLIVVLAASFYMVGCGGGGGGSSFQPTPTPTPTGTTSTINVTATSSGIQHSVAVTVTRN